MSTTQSSARSSLYGWDAPNRVLSWGFLPLIKGFDLGYSTEYRTGFPFYLVDNQRQLAPLPGTQTIPAFLRFPSYFTLNTHFEKRFHALGFYWALRGGFDNLTSHRNYGLVNNDVDSPQFLTFSGFTGRSFTGRNSVPGKEVISCCSFRGRIAFCSRAHFSTGPVNRKDDPSLQSTMP